MQITRFVKEGKEGTVTTVSNVSLSGDRVIRKSYILTRYSLLSLSTSTQLGITTVCPSIGTL